MIFFINKLLLQPDVVFDSVSNGRNFYYRNLQNYKKNFSGGSIGPMVEWLKIKKAEEEPENAHEDELKSLHEPCSIETNHALTSVPQNNIVNSQIHQRTVM